MCAVPAPINVGTGNKYFEEIDYHGLGAESAVALVFRRYYNSVLVDRLDGSRTLQVPGAPAAFGPSWRSTFSRKLSFSGILAELISAERHDGVVLTFRLSGSVYVADADVAHRLVRETDSGGQARYRLIAPDRDIEETYDQYGRLHSVSSRSGVTLSMEYDARGDLVRVVDAVGRELRIRYNSRGSIDQITDPAVGLYVYTYQGDRLTRVTYPDGTFRQYLYENISWPYLVTGIVDENGQQYAAVQYDAARRAIMSRIGGGIEYNVSYEPNGRALVTSPLGAQRTAAFQTILGVPQNAAVDGPSGSNCGLPHAATTRNASGLRESATDWNGTRTTHQHDLTRNLETSRTEASGTPVARTITTEWHPTFRLPTQITEPGRITAMAYDARGNMTSRTVTDTASGRTRTWTWTHTYSALVPGMSERTVADGPRSDVPDTTTSEYWPADAACTGSSPTGCRGQLRRTTNALGHVTEVGEYNAHGQPTRITDPNGLVTLLAYDLRQRLISRTVGAETTAYEYDPVGSLIKTTFPDSTFLEYGYDDAHRLVEIRDALGNRRVSTLDGMGNRTVEETYDAQNVLRSRVSKEFNAENRLQAVIGGTDPAAQVTRYTHDPQGNLKTIDGPLGSVPNDVLTLSFDPLNRLEKSIDALGGTTRFQYDALDRLLSVVDPRGVPTTYAVDAFGDRLQEISRDRGTTVFTFDEAGNPRSVVDGRGRAITYQTDALGRHVRRSVYSDAPWEYDGAAGGDPNAKGRLTKAHASPGWTSFRYDPHGRIIEKTQAAGNVTRTVGYGYDAAGRQSSMTYPSGKVITYAHDAQGRVSAIRLGGVDILSSARYFPFGAVEAFVWGNGTHYARGFDLDGRVVSFPAGASTRTITYDAAGRVAAISDSATPALDFSASYDANDRLVAYAGFPASQAFSYDANGNRSAITVEANTYPYTVDPGSNRLAAIAGPAPARAYVYDGMGNIISDGTRTFGYDPVGRLGGVSVGGRAGPSFAHNAFGERVRKGPGGRGNFAYDEGGRLIGEYETWQSLIPQEYVYLGNQLVAILKGTTTSPELYYVHTDQLGSPRVVLDTQNRQRWRWEGGPFGDNLPDQNPVGLGMFALNLRFPGQYYDVETGLHYNYFRDYDPQTGRYVQSDPIGLAGGLNTYLYAQANPQRWIDPYGLKSRVCCRLIPAIGLFGYRHCYVETATSGSTATYGLIGGTLSGQPAFTGNIVINNTFDLGGECGEWVDECTTDQCVKDQVDFYANPSEYQYTGPNSNTFVGTIARACKLPRPSLGVFATPGWSYDPAPQVEGIPYQAPRNLRP